MTIHNLINNKLNEAGVTVTFPVRVIADKYGLRKGQYFIPRVEVTVGEFTVIGPAYISGDLASHVDKHMKALEKPPQLWPSHCTRGVAEKKGDDTNDNAG